MSERVTERIWLYRLYRVLATAVADSDVDLKERTIGDFLFESGYVARRTDIIADVIVKARILRERRN